MDSERIAAIRKQQRLNKIREIQAKNAAPKAEVIEEAVIDEEVPEERGMLDNINDRIQAFTQGVTLNSMDEIGSSALASLKPAINWAAGNESDERSWDERYDDYHQSYQDDRERFADENPVESLAWEMGGGMMVPGGAVKNLKNAGRVKKLLSGTATGMAQGGVAGAMAADQGDRLTGAALGTTIGGALPVALNALTGTAGTIARRRVAKELGDDDNFTPIHRAGEGTIKEIYRNMLGRVGGAKTVLQNQDKPFVDAAKERLGKEIGEVEKHVDVQEARKVVLAERKSAEALAIDTAARKQVKNAARAKTKEVTELDQVAEAQGRKIDQAVERDAQQQTETFRRAAIDDAMPSTMPAKIKAEVQKMSPRQAEQRISKWWDDDGFGMVKNRTFDWDKGLKVGIRKLLNDDPVLLNEVGGSLRQINEIEKLFGGPLKKASKARKTATKASGTEVGIPSKELTPSGRELADMLSGDGNVQIDGAALLEMRNFFARGANKGLSLPGKGKRTIADEFDALMFKQLGKDGDLYSEELSKWGSKQALSAATRRGRDNARDFDARDWTKLSNQGDTELRELGEGTISRAAEVKKIAPQQKRLIKATNAKAKAIAKDTVDDAKEKVVVEAKRLKRASKMKGSNKTGNRKRLRAARKKLSEARENLGKVNKESIPEDGSGWSTLMLTGALGGMGLLGTLGGGPLAGAAAIASGVALGKGLTGKAGQRVVAGQAPWQGKIRDFAGDKMTRELSKRLRQTTAREAGSRAGE